MIPSNKRKFGQETTSILTFRYFDDVIPEQPESLRFSIPLTKILRTQSGCYKGKNTLYGIDITEVSECKLIYQKY